MEATVAGQLKIGKRFALLFGAFFILVVAVLLHVEYLYYMSLALAVTPGLAYLVGWQSLRSVEARREAQAVAKAGERVAMRITLTNGGATRKGQLVVRDHLPSGLQAEGSTERYVMDLAPGEAVSVEYPLLARRRGVYYLGYVDLMCTDPLGLFNHHDERPAEGLLIVHPRPIPLPRVRPPAAGTLVTSRLRLRKRGEGTDFCGVREYTPGDDLRRIDWKTTARRGKLTVVEYESGEANNVAVALDLSPAFHAGQEDEHTLEYGVTLAASIARQALRWGSEFSLVAEGRNGHSHRSLVSEQSEPLVLDALARVRADATDSFAQTLLAFESWLPPGSGVVVISPSVGPEAVAAARRLVALGHGLLWVSLVAPTFAVEGQPARADEAAYEELARGLASARCAVRQIRRGDDLATRMGVSLGAR
jgi:uncharacterized repeat protein (TIGR01451 family)